MSKTVGNFDEIKKTMVDVIQGISEENDSKGIVVVFSNKQVQVLCINASNLERVGLLETAKHTFNVDSFS